MAVPARRAVYSVMQSSVMIFQDGLSVYELKGILFDQSGSNYWPPF